MRLSNLLSLAALLSVVESVPLGTRDTNNQAGKKKEQKEIIINGVSLKQKYFRESNFHPHYDGRFTNHKLGYVEQRKALKSLVQTYLATFADIGVETWLVHGSLLGWWWNKQIMPWDSDVDVQVTESSMYYLAAYYNMSVFHYKTPRIPEGRNYMLEINPHYVVREQIDKLNVIDARWIDTTTGLFIDITTARYNVTHPQGEGMISCKDGHEYRDTYLFPLRDTIFEGVAVKIPYRYKELLAAEYGEKSLTNKDFHDHIFDDEKMQWIPKMKQITLADLKKDQKAKDDKNGSGKNGQKTNQQSSQKEGNKGGGATGEKPGAPKEAASAPSQAKIAKDEGKVQTASSQPNEGGKTTEGRPS